jgi:hypothetical protein
MTWDHLGGRFWETKAAERIDNNYPLVICNIAMENGPFIDGLPIKNGDVPWLC